MRKIKNDYNAAARYQNIVDACRTTGLSRNYLRNGCRDGTIPHVRCGRVYMIDIPGLYAALERQQAQNTNA